MIAWFTAALAAPVVLDTGFAQVGTFDGRLTPEVSGMALSSDGDRWYVANDSGDSSRFFTSALDGSGLREVVVDAPRPSDVEDMAVGPCGAGRCVFLGDVGDNDLVRASVRVVLVQELATWSGSVRPHKTLVLRYPSGPRNVEAMAVHPRTGDLFLVTKQSNDPEVYRVGAEAMATAADGATLTPTKAGVIDLGALFAGANETVTGMAISPDGSRFALLSYTEFYEFQFDLAVLAASTFNLEVDRAVYRPQRLQQQEAIAYGPGRVLHFTTETGSASPAPLVRAPVWAQPSGPPVLVVAPTVSGVHASGRTLEAHAGTWGGAQPVTTGFVWKRCNAAGKGCLAIPRAKGDTYTLTDAEVGRTVRLRVNVSNVDGKAWASTVPTLVGPATVDDAR